MDDKSISSTSSNGSDSVTLPHKKSCIPSLGFDIGGTMAKLVFFEPDLSPEEMNAEDERFSKHLESRLGDISGVKDDQFQLQNVKLREKQGSIHFILFPTDHIKEFISILKTNKYGSKINTVHATGGGAFKYAELFRTEGNIKVVQHDDECASIIKGIKKLNEACKANGQTICYSIKSPMSPGPIEKVPYEIDDPYPFIATNIGTAVTMIHVNSENEISANNGTPLGGSSFLGLCYLLTGCNTFDKAMELVARGDHTNIDKVLSDIYGDKAATIREGLPSSFIACNFGKLTDEKFRKDAKKEDVAKSLLLAVTDNIGHISADAATKLDVDKVIYCGSFLRGNPTALRTLALSTMFWSKATGLKRPLFLEHQGYLGAAGVLFEN